MVGFVASKIRDIGALMPLCLVALKFKIA